MEADSPGQLVDVSSQLGIFSPLSLATPASEGKQPFSSPVSLCEIGVPINHLASSCSGS